MTPSKIAIDLASRVASRSYLATDMRAMDAAVLIQGEFDRVRLTAINDCIALVEHEKFDLQYPNPVQSECNAVLQRVIQQLKAQTV
jgi:hypothetical protein